MAIYTEIISEIDMKLIVIDELAKYQGDYDSLDILCIYERTIENNHSKKNTKYKKVISTNYQTTKGNWSTGFGTLDFELSNITSRLRNAKLNQIID